MRESVKIQLAVICVLVVTGSSIGGFVIYEQRYSIKALRAKQGFGRVGERTPTPTHIGSTAFLHTGTCAVNEEALFDLVQTTRTQDSPGLQGLIARKRAFIVGAGDRMEVYYEHDGVVRGRVTSGTSIGLRCSISSATVRRVSSEDRSSSVITGSAPNSPDPGELEKMRSENRELNRRIDRALSKK